MKINRDWLTIKEAAVKLGVSRQRMHEIIRFHKAETLQINARLKFVSSKEVKRIEKERNDRK